MPSALDLFSPAAAEWFRGAFPAPTEVLERGWRAVASGRHTLMTAPTGSGKTLAAFFWCLDRLAAEGAGGRRRAQPPRAAGRPPPGGAAPRPAGARRDRRHPQRRHAGRGAA